MCVHAHALMRAYATPSVAIIFRADGVTALIVKQCTDSHSRTIISTRHASLVNTSTKFCAVIIVLVSFFFYIETLPMLELPSINSGPVNGINVFDVRVK